MNKFMVSGRLTSDPELKYTKTDIPYTIIKLANNERKTTVFFDCRAFSKNAELACKYKKKGDWIEVEGHLEKKEKEGEFGLEFIVNEICFGPKTKDEQPQPQQPSVNSDDF